MTSQQYVEGRGHDFCRGCRSEKLFSGLDLGELPIANELLAEQSKTIETFPLHLKICVECGLGQVADAVTPQRIFGDYRYLSSTSTTFLKHSSDFVTEQIRRIVFSVNDWVLEIASNDGYLLRNFLPYGITCIGIEPAENVARIARNQGVSTVSEFFSSNLARELFAEHGYPRLIIANNVLAHVPDISDFVEGLGILSGPSTQISIENPSLANVLVNFQFDTIYHEHYSYLTAYAISKLFGVVGLQLSKVEELSVHGGSNRYWFERMRPESVIDASVTMVIDKEIKSGLFDSNEWTNFSLKVSKILNDFHDWLRRSKEENSRVFGYGAAAKASTLLNLINPESGLIVAIADASLEKQQRFMPPTQIRIISPQEMFDQLPTDVVIFPWNIKAEIAEFLNENMSNDVRLWCVIPNMHMVTP